MDKGGDVDKVTVMDDDDDEDDGGDDEGEGEVYVGDEDGEGDDDDDDDEVITIEFDGAPPSPLVVTILAIDTVDTFTSSSGSICASAHALAATAGGIEASKAFRWM